MIGIGITTRNRRKIALITVSEWLRLLPDGAKLVVVDDASDEPFPNAYRFEQNVGISTAKNKCIELLEGCEHVFLADDDCYPVVENWYEPYINAKQPHLCFTFNKDSVPTGKKELINNVPLMVNNLVRGCMMYFHKSVFEKTGGFDADYIGYGWEHISYSNRIYNAGMTSRRYMDVPDSYKIFHSYDYKRKTESSVRLTERYFELHNKLKCWKDSQGSDCKPYKDYEPLKPVILTAYFTLQKDPQRNTSWPKDTKSLLPLIKSCINKGIDLKIFYDSIFQAEINELEDEGGVEFIRIRPFDDYCTNVYRRIIFYEYLKLRKHPEVFMVDATDVEVLENPFGKLDDFLYTGDEMRSVDNPWMREHQEKLLSIPDYRQVISENASRILPNAGIIGGKYDIVLEFLKENTDIHRKYSHKQKSTTDMAVFNYVVWKYFRDRLFHGKHVNTPFKKNEYTSGRWFKHK